MEAFYSVIHGSCHFQINLVVLRLYLEEMEKKLMKSHIQIKSDQTFIKLNVKAILTWSMSRVQIIFVSWFLVAEPFLWDLHIQDYINNSCILFEIGGTA